MRDCRNIPLETPIYYSQNSTFPIGIFMENGVKWWISFSLRFSLAISKFARKDRVLFDTWRDSGNGDTYSGMSNKRACVAVNADRVCVWREISPATLQDVQIPTSVSFPFIMTFNGRTIHPGAGAVAIISAALNTRTRSETCVVYIMLSSRWRARTRVYTLVFVQH